MKYLISDGILVTEEIGLLLDLLLPFGGPIDAVYSILLLLFETTIENGTKNGQECDADSS